MDAVIFDVDGTLWDSTDEVAISWNKALEDYTELETRMTGDMLKKEFGKPLKEIMESLFPELSDREQEELAVRLYEYENRWVETAPCILYDKMPETVRELSENYKLCIVSNCQAGYIEAFLKNTGLGDCITDYTCPGDTGKLKADNIRMIMEKNGISSAVYVGDTEGDAKACEEAGIEMIYAAYGFGEVKKPHRVIYCFEELPRVLAEMEKAESI